MRKIKLKTYLKVGIFALIFINIFISFCPMISFEGTFKKEVYLFSLNGISLLVDNSKAIYSNMYDTYVYQNMEFVKSSLFISCFSLLFFEGLILLIPNLIKTKFNLNKITYPTLTLLAVINLIMSSMIFYNYPTFDLVYKFSYGLIIFIGLNALIFIGTIIANILTFLPAKECKD